MAADGAIDLGSLQENLVPVAGRIRAEVDQRLGRGPGGGGRVAPM